MEHEVDRRTFLAGAGAVATTALAGCSGDSSDNGTDTPDSGGDTDTATPGDGTVETDDGTSEEINLIAAPIGSLDPTIITAEGNFYPPVMHETLFVYENGLAPAVGNLVTDYTLSDDYLTYTFELKEGVSFHNGAEVTADDVVYSWKRLAYGEQSKGNRDHIVGQSMRVAHEETEDGGVVPGSMALEAVDDYTFEVTLESPFPSTLGWITDKTFAVTPEGIIGDLPDYEGEMSYDEWTTEEMPTPGPWELERWSQGDELVVSRFEDYHGSTANAPRIRFSIVEDPNAQYTRAVNEQNADIFTLPRSKFNPDLLEEGEEIEGGRQLGSYGPVNGNTLDYSAVGTRETRVLQCNTLEVDAPARKALAYAIDQDTIIDQATKGLGSPAYFITPPSGFPGGPERYEELAESEYPYGYATSDIESAREVMEEAGYGPDNQYSTTIQRPSDESASTWRAVTNYVRDLGSSIHIDVDVEAAPISTLISRAIDGDITILCISQTLSWNEADSALQYSHPTPNTWTRWGVGETTDASERASEAWDTYQENGIPTEEAQEARNEAYLTIERANWEDIPLIPLWNPTQQTYWYDWVENYEAYAALRRSNLTEVSIGDRS